jgi:hypothetical protein
MFGTQVLYCTLNRTRVNFCMSFDSYNYHDNCMNYMNLVGFTCDFCGLMRGGLRA